MRVRNRFSRRLYGGCIVVVLATGQVAASTSPALAYFGPGAGVTMMGALWAVLAAVFVALGTILFWPIRTYFRRRRKAAEAAASSVLDEQIPMTQGSLSTSDGGEDRSKADAAKRQLN